MSSNNNAPNEFRENYSSSTFFVGDPSKITCCYCKAAHPSNQCKIVTEVSARKSILQQKNKYFNCLRAGHFIKNCQKDSKCYSCGGRHHISMCERKEFKNNSEHQSKVQKDQQQESCEGKETETPGSTAMLINNNSGHTLLQTAKTWLSSTVLTEKALMGRVMFDKKEKLKKKKLWSKRSEPRNIPYKF